MLASLWIIWPCMRFIFSPNFKQIVILLDVSLSYKACCIRAVIQLIHNNGPPKGERKISPFCKHQHHMIQQRWPIHRILIGPHAQFNTSFHCLGWPNWTLTIEENTWIRNWSLKREALSNEWRRIQLPGNL